MDEFEHLRQPASAARDGEAATSDANPANALPRPEGAAPTLFQRLTDWFWGDIQVPNTPPAPAPAIEPVEELVGGGDDVQEAPFVPVVNGEPVIEPLGGNAAPPAAGPDPEVIAAAQQAGLDAEVVEDAEDLEGIMELIGLQGPLLGLVQTSSFCSVLVTSTIFACVGVPYLFGRVVLSFIGAPVTFLFKAPLQIASHIADVVIDATIFLSGWLALSFLKLVDVVLIGVQFWVKEQSDSRILDRIADFAKSAAYASGARLHDLFAAKQPPGSLGWSWWYLRHSVSAHASLRTLQGEVSAVHQYVGDVITAVVDTISSGSISLAWERSVNVWSGLIGIFTGLPSGAEFWETYGRPLIDAFTGLKSGALTFSASSVPSDPSLVYWDFTDRSLAVVSGYLALAALAAIYVAVDTPITRSESGQKTEKMIRDTLRQAGGVLKVIIIISIEMLAFPLYCGILLDLAFLPLFKTASVATRWGFAASTPYTFCFVHWFVGTCYMFHFALFVGMCRKILRKGVLWFIRDPDDPTFHPVRDVLERNVTTQLRKIAFSALVYGALVILCLGGVIWGIGHTFSGIFPIYWVSTEPVLEFPMDLLVCNFLTPLLIRLFKPSDAVHAMYAWWLRRCARVLRLSHFLFDDRQKDEEGRQVRKTWRSFLLMRTAPMEESLTGEQPQQLTEDGEESDVYFQRNGKYVLTPCTDQYRPPKPDEAFLHTDDDDDDVYITDKDGNKSTDFAAVYIPPHFRLRITLFMVCLWVFSAFTGLCSTLVPLVFGRRLLALCLPTGMRVNDIYAYSVGAYILGAALFAALKGRSTARYLRAKAPAIDVRAWATTIAAHALRAAKCVYVYGMLGLALPLAFALLLQAYLILPLHTYAAASTAAGAAPGLAEHSVHVLADYALGMLYVRILMRTVLTHPASRAAEAFRRITAAGYLNPDARLATRVFVLPATLLVAVLFLAPLALARLGLALDTVLLQGGEDRAEDGRTKVYRYAYPVAAAGVVLFLAGRGVEKVVGRWRARIRDEVYLVGERLHNFGERRPPVGTKSVVRKER